MERRWVVSASKQCIAWTVSVGASMLAMVSHSPLAIWVYISISAVTPAYGLRRSPVGASLLAMGCHSPLAIWVYISVAAVPAAYGFALTATPFSKRRKGSKRLCPSIRPLAKARGTLTPALLRGPAATGHPWPDAAIPASMPGCPLRNACVRPLGKGQVEQDQKPQPQQSSANSAPEDETNPL
jgi:hypothetical protein